MSECRCTKEINEMCHHCACLGFLGITADQLLIARALDREKVEEIRCGLEAVIAFCRRGSFTGEETFSKLIAMLPTFATAEASGDATPDGHEVSE